MDTVNPFQALYVQVGQNEKRAEKACAKAEKGDQKREHQEGTL
jgi:hypothetical protein